MGNFYASGFWGMIYLICIIAICGMLQAMCQFCAYIFPTIKKICKCIKYKFININIHEYINRSCNKITNEYFIKNIKEFSNVKSNTIVPIAVITDKALHV
jgi:hypothetical protein